MRRPKLHLAIFAGCLIAVICFPCDVLATDYFVRKTGNNGAAGTSAAAAWLTVDHAADNVTAGDTIYVGAGTYDEQIGPNSTGTETDPIVFIADTNGIYTGDAGDVILISSSTRYIIYNTVTGHDYYTFRGFKIDGCNSSSYAIYFSHSNGIVIEDCEICNAGSIGVCIGYGDMVLRNSSIHGNQTLNLHVLYDTAITIEDTSIHSSRYGIYSPSSNLTVTVKRCHIYDNMVLGVYIRGCDATLNNCLIERNGSYGMYARPYVGKSLSMRNCTVANNGHTGVYVGSGTASISNCIIANNTTSGITGSATLPHTYNLVYGNGSNFVGTSKHSTEIVADPLFLGGNDYQIPSNSPAVDSGTDMTGTISVDITGRPRPYDGAYDIGCYEEGPAGYWKLDETSGVIAADSSGLGNDGAFRNTPVLGSCGIRGNSTTFNGSNEYIEIAHSSDYHADNGTVAFWFYANDLSRRQGLFSKDASGYVTGGHLNIFLAASKQAVSVRFQSATQSYQLWSSSIKAGRWYHVAFCWGANGMRLYLDGVEVDADSYTGGLGASSGGTGNFEPIALGANTGISGSLTITPLTDYFDGRLDDVRFYNRCLTQTEIVMLYGFIGHWKLNETVGTTAVDSSAIGNDGTYIYGVTLNTTGPYPGEGAIAAAFDGVSSYVNIGDNSALGISEELSIAAWVNPTDYGPSGIILNREGEYEVIIWSDGTIRWAIANASPGWRWINTNYVVPLDSWTHIALTYNGSEIKTYANGKLVHTSSGSGLVGDAHTSQNELWIGARMAGYNQEFCGVVHDVRLYNRTLSAEEIATLYGLIGHWKLDETTGITAIDDTVFGNDGDYENSPTLGESGKIDEAVEFDGLNDRVDVGAFEVDGSTMAIVGWIKAGSFDLVGSRIVAKANGIGASNNYWSLLIYNSGGNNYLGVLLKTDTMGTQLVLSTTDPLGVGQWIHVAFVYDGSTAKLYKNGVEIESSEITGNITAGPTVPVWIGGSPSDEHYFDGLLDDVRIYNRPLWLEEIQALYSGAATKGVRIIKWIEIQ